METKNRIQAVHAKLINFGQIRLIIRRLSHEIIRCSYTSFQNFTGIFELARLLC